MFSRRFACVRQADQSDCGPAALATVALHHRLAVGREKMRDLAGTDRIGTNLAGMVKAAERLGFSARAVKGSYAALAGVPLPAIAHTRTEAGLGHYLVVHRVGKRGVTVADPGRGVLTLTAAEFAARWTGYLVVLTPTARLEAGVAAAPLPPTRRFLQLVATQRGVLVEAFVCALLMTVLALGTSYFVQHLVDFVLMRREGRLLDAFGVGMILIVLFRTLFGLLRQYLLAHVGRRAGLQLISDYTRHILRLPMRFFEMRRVGEIMSRVQDATKVRDAISGVTLTALVDGTLVLISLLVLWRYDGQLALVATATVPIMVATAALHHPAIRRRSRQAMEHGAELSAHFAEDISGVETVKALAMEDRRGEAGEGKLIDVVQAAFRAQLLGISSSTWATATTGLAGVAVLWYGGHRVIDGALSIGQLMFFYSLLANLLGPLERLGSVNMQLQDALVAVDRLYQVLDLDVEQDRATERCRFGGIRDAIVLRDVSFQYGSRSPVLKKIDLRIPAGAKVALVGESGSGKTTILKLLMQFHAPTEGQILVDGVDARDLDVTSLRRGIGLVSQDPFVFTGTVRDNIAMGRPEATLDEVVAAARAAGLEEVIARLPQRFDTVIGERGANLSGGQRQRLAIARALLAKPELLIFDEATSHLDTATERAIQDSLQHALAGKTVVTVAHRLSTIRDADLIYVLEHGQIVEQGTSHELLLLGGRYAALWRAQSLEIPELPRPRAVMAVNHA
jgi:HlyB family type I secretion system ABC transporter